MVTARRRSDRNREDFLDKDDNGNLYVTLGAGGGPTLVGASSTGAAAELEAAATVAAVANNQTLAATAGKRTFISGFLIGGLGATGASVIAVTVSGIAVTMTFRVNIPAGVGVIVPQMFITFPRPIPASADNTAIVVNVPTYGAGNTVADAAAWGFSI